MSSVYVWVLSQYVDYGVDEVLFVFSNEDSACRLLEKLRSMNVDRSDIYFNVAKFELDKGFVL